MPRTTRPRPRLPGTTVDAKPGYLHPLPATVATVQILAPRASDLVAQPATEAPSAA